VTWTTCASEGGTCSFSGTRDVRYGTATSYVIKTFTGSVACTNAVFGDPAHGYVKSCSYSSVTK
jgi:serine protease